jgi:hypothetical protein
MLDKVFVWFYDSFCLAYNWNANKLRSKLGYGPSLLMHKTLAYNIIEKGDWHPIPLRGGTRTPLLSAISYLVHIGDRQAIPILKNLFDRYTQESYWEKSWGSLCFSGGISASLYNHADYVPAIIQRQAGDALLHLMQDFEAREFIREMLFSEREFHSETIRVFTRFVETESSFFCCK